MGKRDLPRRKPLRLPTFDYRNPGGYFVTICVRNREEMLGDVSAAEMQLSAIGEIVQSCWLHLPEHYPTLILDEFVVMPDHLHGIIILQDQRAGLRPAPTKDVESQTLPSLSEIVRAFKSFSSREMNRLCGVPGISNWQRGYYERIIRNPLEADLIREYIADNPRLWISGASDDDDFLGMFCE
jgi:REP element-mobilizing transposase RayT